MTKEYLRFAEFCDACRNRHYIGLCYGVPGVGKTVSARHYSHWSELETLAGPPPYRYSGIPGRESGPWRTVLYTPGVVNTPRIIQRDVEAAWAAMFGLADRLHQHSEHRPRPQSPDLIIVDEADRLKTAGLEQLRNRGVSPEVRGGWAIRPTQSRVLRSIAEAAGLPIETIVSHMG